MKAHLKSLRPELHRFLEWWLAEMLALTPARLRAGARGRATVTLDGAIILGQTTRDGWTQAASLPLEEGPLLSARLAELGLGGKPPVLRLPPGQSLRCTILLPLAAEPDLHNALAWQIDRHTPFHAEDVHYGMALRRRNLEQRQMEVELAVAPKQLVAELTARLQVLGVQIGPVSVAGAAGQPDIPIGAGVDAGSSMARPRAVAIPLGVAAALGLACVATPLVRGHMHLAALEAELAHVKAEALAAAELGRSAEQEARRLAYAANRRRAQPSMALTLAELTRLVPDGTWATHVVIEGDTVQFTGFSPSANALVNALEQSAAFSRASFRSPVTQHAQTGLEQFHLAADLRGRQP